LRQDTFDLKANGTMHDAIGTARIVLMSGNHLCHNPRVVKEADTLDAAGYQVEVLGCWFDPGMTDRDRKLLADRRWVFHAAIDTTNAGMSRGVAHRARARVGRLLGSRFKVSNHWELGAAAPELLHAATQTNADLYVAHSEQALWVADRLRRAGRRVGVDMEDWFSEDLLPAVRANRPVQLLRALERQVLQHAAYASCPSEAMSVALAAKYNCEPPTILYNAFPLSDRATLDGAVKDRRDRGIPSIHWYSQTLGEGRGLEDLLAALPRIARPAELHLRGNPAKGFDGWLASRVPAEWRDRVFTHGLVSNDELLSRIAEHDIGFAGEMKYSRSRVLTVTNKMLHYLLAGLAVVASDTAGQQEIARQGPDAVFLYPSGDSAALAATLDKLLTSSAVLQHAKAAALRVAERGLCWECQKGKLLAAVAGALVRPMPRTQTG
jgi:glycosyltransferase involved in cell wall biosynthesis